MPEKEYIERKKLNDMLGVFCMSESLYEVLQTIPTSDVQPVKHGHWCDRYRSGAPAGNGVVSSCCDMWNERKTDFCPNCGAKMDGGDG